MNSILALQSQQNVVSLTLQKVGAWLMGGSTRLVAENQGNFSMVGSLQFFFSVLSLALLGSFLVKLGERWLSSSEFPASSGEWSTLGYFDLRNALRVFFSLLVFFSFSDLENNHFQLGWDNL